MIIGEFTTNSVAFVAPETTLRQAAAVLRDGTAPVLVVAEEGQLIGTLSDRDLARRGCGEGLDPDTATVAAVCDRAPPTCPVDQRLSAALALMIRHDQPWLLVLGAEREIVGCVSLRALLELFVDLVPEESNGPEPDYVRRVRGDPAD